MPKISLNASGLAYLESFPSWDTDTESDGAFHNRAALGVMTTGIPRTRSGSFMDHSPLYAYFTASCYSIGGLRLLALAIPQAIVTGLIGLLLGLAASRAFPNRCNRIAAVVVGLLVTVNLQLGLFVAYPVPAILLMLFFAIGIWAITAPNRNRFWLFVTAISAGIFTHAGFFVVGGAAGLWLLVRFAQTRTRIYLFSAIFLLVAAGLKLGIGLIDSGANKSDHLRKAAQGLVWQGNNPYYEDLPWHALWEQRIGAPTRWQKWRRSDLQEQRFNDYLQRADGDYKAAGWLWIRENPGQYLKLCLIRLRTELGPFNGQASLPRKLMGLFVWGLIFPAGFYMLWRLRRDPFSLFAILVIGAVLAFDGLVFSNFRYRLPVDLLLTIYAGMFYASLFKKWGDPELMQSEEVNVSSKIEK